MLPAKQPMQIRLREWRERRGLTQRELADKAKISVMSVIRLEGDSESPSPTLAMLEKLAGSLGITVRQLLPPESRRKTGGKS